MRPRRIPAAGLLAAALVLAAPAATGAQPPTVHDPAAVRARAEEILAREEFRPAAPSVVERAVDWVADHLLGGDSDGGGSSGRGDGSVAVSAGSSILTTVLLVLALVGLGVVVRVLLAQRRLGRRPRPDPVAIDVEGRRTAEAWTEAAEEAEAAGDWKEGLRCRFRALVEALVDAGAVPDVAGRTAGELRGDLAASTPTAAAAFDGAAGLFERAFYGDLPTGPDEARRFAALAAGVLAAVDARIPDPEPAPAGAAP